MNRPCKLCASGTMVQPAGKMYAICDMCNGAEILYVPQPHQKEFHEDTHTFKALFGAYGSGKTTTAVLEIIEHVLSTPNGRTAMLAPTMTMLKATSYKELMIWLPHTFIDVEYKSKGSERIIMNNGHEIIFLPSNSADRIRSLNLTAFYLEEASNSKYELFAELQARTRNEKAFIYETDEAGNELREWDEDLQVYRKVPKYNKLLGVICSNPDVGWIRTEILFKSGEVYAPKKYPRKMEDCNPFLSTHIHDSFQNKYLDPDFQERMSRGKPEWWIKRYIYGSFDYAEGLVYPTMTENIVDPFVIPGHWKRMFGVDFGLRDPTVMLGLAIDPDSGIGYIYTEHYENEKPVNHHAHLMKAILASVPYGMLYGQIIADPAGKQTKGDGSRSYFSHYAEYGLWFKPGNNSLMSGIMKVYTYLSLGKLKIFSNCVNTIMEAREYKYDKEELDLAKNRGEKPKDAHNHAMDVIRYIINELPDDPERMVTEVYLSKAVTGYSQSKFKFPDALSDDDMHNDDWYNSF